MASAECQTVGPVELSTAKNADVVIGAAFLPETVPGPRAQPAAAAVAGALQSSAWPASAAPNVAAVASLPLPKMVTISPKMVTISGVRYMAVDDSPMDDGPVVAPSTPPPPTASTADVAAAAAAAAASNPIAASLAASTTTNATTQTQPGPAAATFPAAVMSVTGSIDAAFQTGASEDRPEEATGLRGWGREGDADTFGYISRFSEFERDPDQTRERARSPHRHSHAWGAGGAPVWVGGAADEGRHPRDPGMAVDEWFGINHGYSSGTAPGDPQAWLSSLQRPPSLLAPVSGPHDPRGAAGQHPGVSGDSSLSFTRRDRGDRGGRPRTAAPLDMLDMLRGGVPVAQEAFPVSLLDLIDATEPEAPRLPAVEMSKMSGGYRIGYELHARTSTSTSASPRRAPAGPRQLPRGDDRLPRGDDRFRNPGYGGHAGRTRVVAKHAATPTSGLTPSGRPSHRLSHRTPAGLDDSLREALDLTLLLNTE